MTAGPGDEMAAAGRGRLRASHADREQVIGMIKVAFVQGRLTKDEFDQRVSQTLGSRTYAELAALTADIPAWLIGAQPRKPARAHPRPRTHKVVIWGEWLAIAASVLFGAIFFNPAGLAVAVLTILIIGPIVVTQMLDSRQQRRSGRRLPPRPAQPGQVLRPERDAAPGDDLILAEVGSGAGTRRVPDHSATERTLRSIRVRRDQGRPASRPATA